MSAVRPNYPPPFPDQSAVSKSGFQATASTLLNEMRRWNPDAIEPQLVHVEENDIRRAYMHAAEFWNERVEIMQVWADAGQVGMCTSDELRWGGRAWRSRGSEATAGGQQARGGKPREIPSRQ